MIIYHQSQITCVLESTFGLLHRIYARPSSSSPVRTSLTNPQSLGSVCLVLVEPGLVQVDPEPGATVLNWTVMMSKGQKELLFSYSLSLSFFLS